MFHIALCLAASWQTVLLRDLCNRCQDCISGRGGVYFYVTILNNALWISVLTEALKIKIKWSIFFYLSFKNIWKLTNLLTCLLGMLYRVFTLFGYVICIWLHYFKYEGKLNCKLKLSSQHGLSMAYDLKFHVFLPLPTLRAVPYDLWPLSSRDPIPFIGFKFTRAFTLWLFWTCPLSLVGVSIIWRLHDHFRNFSCDSIFWEI